MEKIYYIVCENLRKFGKFVLEETKNINIKDPKSYWFLIVLFFLILIRLLFKKLSKVPLSSHTEVCEFPGKTKDQLYVESRDWFVETFTDSKSVLEVQDRGEGILKGKGRLDTLTTVLKLAHSLLKIKRGQYCMSTFTIGITVKDGKSMINVKESNREWFPKNLACSIKQQKVFSRLSGIYCNMYKNFINNSNSKADF